MLLDRFGISETGDNYVKRNQITALYCRLSQVRATALKIRSIYLKNADEQGLVNTRFYVDDGVLVVKFDRPDLNQMVTDAEAGKREFILKGIGKINLEVLSL